MQNQRTSDMNTAKEDMVSIRHLHEALYSEITAILYSEIKTSEDNISQEHLH